MRGFEWKMPIFVRDLNFWPALHTPRPFSQKAQGTDLGDHLLVLCAFWTAGFTARPPDISVCVVYPDISGIKSNN
jgi:hypothetical protein